jgi:hypothetical protein
MTALLARRAGVAALVAGLTEAGFEHVDLRCDTR